MKILQAPPKLITGLAERKERSPKIAILDTFAAKGESPDHGDKVESVLLSAGGWRDRDVQNLNNSYEIDLELEDVTRVGADQFRARLKDYVVQRISRFYRATAHNLRSIVEDDKNKIRVLNQSQSQCPARLARPLVRELYADPELRRRLREAYGLHPHCRKANIAEAVLDDIHDIFDQSGSIDRARRIYRNQAQKAYKLGIVHVVTAGNLGRQAASYEKMGIDVQPDTYRSIFANEFTTVVAAIDGRGTNTRRDDRAADFTSPYAGAEFGMNGLNVAWESDELHGDSDGTSFAAPQVTALVAEMFSINPDLTVDEVEDYLTRSCLPVAGEAFQVGAGLIDSERALMLAHQARRVRR